MDQRPDLVENRIENERLANQTENGERNGEGTQGQVGDAQIDNVEIAGRGASVGHGLAGALPHDNERDKGVGGET